MRTQHPQTIHIWIITVQSHIAAHHNTIPHHSTDYNTLPCSVMKVQQHTTPHNTAPHITVWCNTRRHIAHNYLPQHRPTHNNIIVWCAHVFSCISTYYTIDQGRIVCYKHTQQHITTWHNIQQHSMSTTNITTYCKGLLNTTTYNNTLQHTTMHQSLHIYNLPDSTTQHDSKQTHAI
jgi:hypothetical protein